MERFQYGSLSILRKIERNAVFAVGEIKTIVLKLPRTLAVYKPINPALPNRQETMIRNRLGGILYRLIRHLGGLGIVCSSCIWSISMILVYF